MLFSFCEKHWISLNTWISLKIGPQAKLFFLILSRSKFIAYKWNHQKRSMRFCLSLWKNTRYDCETGTHQNIILGMKSALLLRKNDLLSSHKTIPISLYLIQKHILIEQSIYVSSTIQPTYVIFTQSIRLFVSVFVTKIFSIMARQLSTRLLFR